MRLPDSYQVTHRKWRFCSTYAHRGPKLAFPKQGFDSCCSFNKSYKITPDVFECLDVAAACGPWKCAVALP